MYRIERRVIAVIALWSGACAAPRRPAPLRATESLSFSGEWGEPVSRTRTASAALDRIGKRLPRLDSTIRRSRTGRGVSIYVFDGGISDQHEELAGRVRRGFDAFPSGPRICNPHGTAVAGAAAGATLGVAPDAEIVDVKIINCDHLRGSVSAILAAARWTVADHARHPERPAVANWSFMVDTGRTVSEVDSAAALLHDAGIVVVVAAGNVETNACRVSPANAANTIVVGASALTRDAASAKAWHDVRAQNTAWGRCISLYAPGDSVLLPGVDRGTPMVGAWNGTSMAAGYTSGAVALILERDPAASPDHVAQTLVWSATPNVVDERRDAANTARSRLLYIGPAERVIASASHGRH